MLTKDEVPQTFVNIASIGSAAGFLVTLDVQKARRHQQIFFPKCRAIFGLSTSLTVSVFQQS